MSNRINAGDRAKQEFTEPEWTAKGERRAVVAFAGVETPWIKTGTPCNFAYVNYCIESSLKNDALVYMTMAEAVGKRIVTRYLVAAAGICTLIGLGMLATLPVVLSRGRGQQA